MKIPFTLLLLIIIPCLAGQNYTDSIYDQGKWRSYQLHLPKGYNNSISYPIVLNLHGLNSNGAQQENYTQFDNVADTLLFIVAYPNGMNRQWDMISNTDIDFLSHLVDTLRSRYSSNSCLFITGISDGGFMTYKLACSFPKHIDAIAVVSGNMAKSLQSSCALTYHIPILHFHGTADQIVKFAGVPPLIPPVDSTIAWWARRYGIPFDNGGSYPDLVTSDSCQAEYRNFFSRKTGHFVKYIVINNGGHTWPGATPVPPLGNTNEDITASGMIGSFFAGYCRYNLHSKSVNANENIYPNPSDNYTRLPAFFNNQTIEVFDQAGRKFASVQIDNRELKTSNWPQGIYLLHSSALQLNYRLFVIH